MSIGAIGQAALGAVAVGKTIAASATTDAYQIVRGTSRTPDGAGGYTETPNVVESGRCILTAGAVNPTEAAIAARLGVVNPYVVRALPAISVVTEQDTIVIGGRTFEVKGLRKPETMRAVITAICVEIG